MDDAKPQSTGGTLVRGFLDQGVGAVVFGASNSGKTFWALDLGAHIAAGKPWREREVTQGIVVYIAVEAARSVENRMYAWKTHHAASNVPFFELAASVDLKDPLGDTGPIITMLNDLSRTLELPIRLVIVDTLFRALAGGSDNSPEDMGALCTNVARILEEVGCTVLLIHHTGKDKAQGSRGHSSLKANVDTEIAIDDSIARVTKQRDLEAGEEFPFKLEIIQIGAHEDGVPMTTCVCVPEEHQLKSRKERKLSDKQRIAFDALVRALTDNGTEAPASNHVPPKAQIVPLETWRTYVYSAGIADSEKQDARRQAFHRAREALIAKGFIGQHNELVWIVRHT